MKKEFWEIFSGLKSLYVGMRITIKEFVKPAVTVHYPHESTKMAPRFRGHIELVTDPATGKPLCFACKLCERACPSDCITVEGAKLDGGKKKSVTNYILDFTKCSLCGSCVEACRDGAIRFSREYNLAALSKEEYVMDLFQRLEKEAVNTAAETDSTAAAPTPAATPPPETPSPIATPAVEPAQSQPGEKEPASRVPPPPDLKQ